VKYRVYGSVSVGVTIKVEAESEEAAIEAAYSEFPGLSGYCGNGGTDKLVGVYDSAVSLDAGYSEVEFTEAEPQSP
jgi:hypothetical protein